MSEEETYPTLEFLHKVAQKAVILEEKRHSGTFVKVGMPNVSIKSMMTDETFILPMEPEQPGSELYRRVICKFGITPAILRRLHMERLFSEEQVDQHINYYEEHYQVKIKRTKSDIPDESIFTEEEIKNYDENTALRMQTQPRVTRKPLVKKWLDQPIEYPTEPDDMGNMKYRHLLLFHGFTSNLKLELKKMLKTNARINQHITFMRKSYNIGNQRGKGNYGKHATPSRFPELSYWPSLQMFSENKDARVATSSQHGATPAVNPSATIGAGPSATPAGSKSVDPSSLPPHKRYLRTQDIEKLPDLVVGREGEMELMELETLGQDTPNTPKESTPVLPGGEDSDVSRLSRTIGSLTVEQDPHLREQIGQLDSTNVSQFIGQFVQTLTTTSSAKIPPSLPQDVVTEITQKDVTPSTSDPGLRILHVMSLSEPNVPVPTPNIPTARKRTGGQAPMRI